MAGYQIPEHYPRQFDTNFAHEVQQADSKFKGLIAADTRWTGKEFIYRDLSKNTWVRNDTRGGTTVARESEATFRRMFKKKVEAEAIEFPEWDEELLAQIVHPKSAEIEALRMGYERAFDDLCVEACFEDAYGGPEPHTTAIPFPEAQQVNIRYGTPSTPDAGSDQPMTPWKLLKAKTMFEQLDLDLDREEVCLAMSPQEELDLIQYVSTAPNEVWAKMIAHWMQSLAEGNHNAKLLGIYKVVKTNRLPETASVRTCVAFLRSGFVKSAADQIKSSLDRVPQDKNKLLLQGSAMVGIGRRRDEKFIWIPCYHDA